MHIFKETRPATLSNVSWLRRALCAELGNLRLKPELIDDLALVISEIGANAVMHGAPKASTIEVELVLKGASLRLSIRDDGGALRNFASLIDKPVAFEAHQESGRGLALVRSALDQLHYKAGSPNTFVGWRSLHASRPRVLIIEDTPSLLDLYSEFLSQDYNVIGCMSLDEAREAIRTSKFDAILADLHLGDGMSSILLQETGEHGSLDGAPIVFISSDQTGDSRDACLRDGGEFFIEKPVQSAELRKTLALAIGRASIRNAKLYRTFARHVAGLIENGLPAQIGSYRSICISGTATAGGGDIALRLPRDGAERIIMADVMGHGVAARAWAISLATMVRTLHRSRPTLSCAEFLTQFACIAWEDPALQGAMSTMLIADMDDEGVTIASAGHPAPFLVARQVTRIDVSGPLLGVVRPISYEPTRVLVTSGERVVLCTDGVDHMDKTCGEALPDWIESTLREHAGAPLQQAADALRQAADATLGPQPPDDWMIMLLERI